MGPAKLVPHWEAEHRATREGVILMDMSLWPSFGPGTRCGRLLNYLSANQVDGPRGVITYTQWLNEAGKLEADLTVTKLDDERFWVVASDTAHRHAETWMRRHFGSQPCVFDRCDVRICAAERCRDRFRERFCSGVTTVDLSNDAFPAHGAGHRHRLCRALCIRITYLGELVTSYTFRPSKRCMSTID